MMAHQQSLPYWRRIWVAITACVCLLLLSLWPPVLEAVLHLDRHLAVSLNGLAGTSPVLDRLLLFVCDGDGHERLLAIVLLYFIIRTITRRSAVLRMRVIGIAQFVFFNCLIYILLDEFLDDILKRQSPSLVIEGFRSLNTINDWSLHLKDKRTWPCSEAALLFLTSFVLLRTGRWKGGSIAMVAGLVLPAGRMVAGLNWFSDIYLGALPLAYLLSAITVETRIGRLEQYFSGVTATATDKAKYYFLRKKPVLKNLKTLWRSQNLLRAEFATKRFILQDLPSILKIDAADKTQKPLVEVPLSGVNCVVRLVTLGSKRVVIRVYPVSQRYEAIQHVGALTLLHNHSIPAPEVLHQEVTRATSGAAFVVEEFLNGEAPGNTLSDAQLDAIATTVSRLHGVKNNKWGPIDNLQTTDFDRAQLRIVERMIPPVAAANSSEFKTAVPEIRNWFNQRAEALKPIQIFSLVHSDLHRDNGLFLSDGSFCLLDCASLQWSVPPVDLVTVYHSLCNGDAESITTFNNRYFAEVDEKSADTIRQLMPFFQANHLLSRMNKLANTLRRGRNDDRSIQLNLKHWKELQTIMQQNP